MAGKVLDSTVVDAIDIIANIEQGAMFDVHAMVIHQTGGSTADSTLSAWKNGKSEGAHFLIDTDGKVYQTARLDQKTFNVGKIRSKCIADGSCGKTSDEYSLLYAKGKGYGTRIKNLHDKEITKTYPSRYPTNDDSIGIELVGACDKNAASIPKNEDCAYVSTTPLQNAALTRLVTFLKGEYKLTDADVYRHPTVSYKNETEAKDADWNLKMPTPKCTIK
jgi:N-acetyl-anhydromuramyl-L-alanine amidase AmpD